MQSIQQLRHQQSNRFSQLLQHGLSPFLSNWWTKHGISANQIVSIEKLIQLPCITKVELIADQMANPPYGTNLTQPFINYVRLHQTSGTTSGQPLRWLDTAQSWEWILQCWQTIYDVVGITRADRFFFPFSFGPFLGFWAAFEGAARRGCLVLPGGGSSTLARLRFLQDNQATIICSTPTYAIRMLEIAHEENISLADSSVRMLILAGEPGANIPATRQLIEAGWGARVIDHWGMTEVGPLGIECLENPGGFHLLENECIAEVLDSESNQEVPPGEEGELVITTLGRLDSPLVRYKTGDRVKVDPNPCPCGKPWKRLQGGILGRTDDMLLVKGNNFYPSMIEAVIRQFTSIEEFQVVLNNRHPGELKLRLELKSNVHADDVTEQVAQRFRDLYQFRPTIEVVGPGTLPRSEMKSKRVIRI